MTSPRIDTMWSPTPILDTSVSPSDPDHANRIQALRDYAFLLWTSLIEQAPAFVPTTEGPYLDVFRDDDNFTSVARSSAAPPFAMGTFTPQQLASRVWNLMSKIADNKEDGSLFVVVAPTATLTERDLLDAAIGSIASPKDTGEDHPATAVIYPQATPVYAWLHDPDEFPGYASAATAARTGTFDPVIQPMLPL